MSFETEGMEEYTPGPLSEEERKKLDGLEKDIHRRFRKDIWGRFLKALRDYHLLEEGDRVACAVSGGKDSTLMAKLFLELRKHSDFPFDLEIMVMDPGYGEETLSLIRENLRLLSMPAHIFKSDIFDTVYVLSGSPCYICARMRRGHLYAAARELSCNKIALGHHFDDVVETILMGMLFGSQMQSMRPKLRSLNFEGMELIRPMYLVREQDILKWQAEYGFIFPGSSCRFSGEEEEDPAFSRRALCKNLIRDLEKTDPDTAVHIFRSSENVMLDTLLCYKKDGRRHHFLEEYDTAVSCGGRPDPPGERGESHPKAYDIEKSRPMT